MLYESSFIGEGPLDALLLGERSLGKKLLDEKSLQDDVSSKESERTQSLGKGALLKGGEQSVVMGF